VVADKVRPFNLAASTRPEAAKSFDALVLRSVGPLGIRIEPTGKNLDV